MFNKKILEIAKIWIPLALTSTVLCAVFYLAVHQNMRQAANDPQIQLAEDRALLLSENKPFTEIVPPTTVDMRRSLGTFFIIFNEQKQIIASSVLLDGHTPTPPDGVFDYVKTHGQNRFTWAPEPEVRVAVVMTSFQGSQPGFILVGRSLREVEKRDYQLTLEVTGVLIASLIISLFAITFLSLLPSKK